MKAITLKKDELFWRMNYSRQDSCPKARGRINHGLWVKGNTPWVPHVIHRWKIRYPVAVFPDKVVGRLFRCASSIPNNKDQETSGILFSVQSPLYANYWLNLFFFPSDFYLTIRKLFCAKDRCTFQQFIVECFIRSVIVTLHLRCFHLRIRQLTAQE